VVSLIRHRHRAATRPTDQTYLQGTEANPDLTWLQDMERTQI